MAIVNTPRSFQFWNAVAATPADFNLDAGIYGVTANTTGTVTLRKLLPDGVTYVIVLTLAATGYATIQLPAGQYQLTITAGTITGEIALIARGGFR